MWSASEAGFDCVARHLQALVHTLYIEHIVNAWSLELFGEMLSVSVLISHNGEASHTLGLLPLKYYVNRPICVFTSGKISL